MLCFNLDTHQSKTLMTLCQCNSRHCWRAPCGFGL